MGRFISLVERYDQIDSILFYRFGICALYYVYFVVHVFFKFQVVVRSLNCPKVENQYKAITFVEYFKVALHVEIKPW